MQGGPGIGALALGSLYGPDSNLGNSLIADPRTVNTDFHPTFFSDEIQAQLRIEHDFGPVTLKVSGQYQRTRTAASQRSEEHTSELQSLMRISYAVFCLQKKTPLLE